MNTASDSKAPPEGTFDRFMFDVFKTNDAVKELKCKAVDCVDVFEEVWTRWNDHRAFLNHFLQNFHECTIGELRSFLKSTKTNGNGADMWELMSRQRQAMESSEKFTFKFFVQSMLPRDRV